VISLFRQTSGFYEPVTALDSAGIERVAGAQRKEKP
jgi:hypothetical protein